MVLQMSGTVAGVETQRRYPTFYTVTFTQIISLDLPAKSEPFLYFVAFRAGILFPKKTIVYTHHVLCEQCMKNIGTVPQMLNQYYLFIAYTRMALLKEAAALSRPSTSTAGAHPSTILLRLNFCKRALQCKYQKPKNFDFSRVSEPINNLKIPLTYTYLSELQFPSFMDCLSGSFDIVLNQICFYQHFKTIKTPL